MPAFQAAASADVLRRAAEQCRQLALLTRTDAARQQLLRLAEQFEARAKHQQTEPKRQIDTIGSSDDRAPDAALDHDDKLSRCA